MIVCAGKDARNRNQIFIGITESDIELLRTGLTRIKQGNDEYGFASLTLFLGEPVGCKTDLQMIDLINKTQGRVVKRSDDMFPDTPLG